MGKMKKTLNILYYTDETVAGRQKQQDRRERQRRKVEVCRKLEK